MTSYKPLPSIAPPRPHEGLFEKIMERRAAMTPQEVFEQAVRIGIYTPDGHFTEAYGGGDARLKPSELTELEQRVLTAVLTDVRQHSVPPTAERVAQLVDTARPSQVLAALVRKGYLEQPYAHGPFIPLRNLDGDPVR